MGRQAVGRCPFMPKSLGGVPEQGRTLLKKMKELKG